MSDAGRGVGSEGLELRVRPRPVTRINRRTLMLVIIAAGVVALLATWWALRVPTHVAGDSESPPAATNSVTRAEGLSSLPSDYDAWRPIPKLGPPAGELGRPVLRSEQEAGIDSSGVQSFRPNPEVDAQRVARLRLQDEAEAAAKAQVFFQTRRSIGAPAAIARPNTAAAVDGHLEPIAPRGEDSEGSDQVRKRRFFDDDPDPRVEASGTLRHPRSAYQLMAGTIISAALVTGINSDLPGQAIASVTQNVFDTVTGEHLLIPQGSRLIGQYDSQVSFGQRRVLLVWTRLIRPDGTSITLDRLQASDASGSSGLEDRVDWHWNRIFAGAAISTLLGVNAELAAHDRGINSDSLIVAGRQSAQDTINQLGQQLTRRNLNIQPTLTVRPGFPIRIVVNADLNLVPE